MNANVRQWLSGLSAVRQQPMVDAFAWQHDDAPSWGRPSAAFSGKALNPERRIVAAHASNAQAAIFGPSAQPQIAIAA